MGFDDDEPVFKRSKWGTNRYVYNARNPMGFALIVLSLVFAGGALLLMHLHAGPFAPPSGPTPVRSELVWLLVDMDKRYTAESPAEDWEMYYAARILDHFGDATR